jgi:hypothetical protein
VSIRKPSEYFDRQKASVENVIQGSIENSELNTFSDAYDAFKRNLSKVDVLTNFSETLGNYQSNIEKVNHLSEKIDEIDEDIKSLLTKEDLDKALVSQLLFLEECIRDVQDKVKSINQKNLIQIRLDVSDLSETVNTFVDDELPKYKKLVVDSELRTDKKFIKLEENVNKTLEDVGEFVDNKYHELTETLRGINEQSLDGILEDFKILDENFAKLREEEIPKYKGFIVETERKTENKLNDFNQVLEETTISLLEKISEVEGDKTDLIKVVNDKLQEVRNFRDLISNDLKESEETRQDLKKKITNLEANIIRNESHIRTQNKSLEQIQEDVKSTIQELNIEEFKRQNYKLGKKIKYLEEVFEKFGEREILTESIITEPPFAKNEDPLTPLDQNFVTFDQLQSHYRLFINRIQQQLSTLGGGGETKLKYLDDIVGIATNSSVYDGKFLKYDHSARKFEFSSATSTSVGEDSIVYVAKNGDDSNAGTLSEPKLTIKAAVDSIVSAGTTDKVVKVAPGSYIENNPIILPDEVTVIGHSLRETTVTPQNANEDLFYVGNGNYIAEMSFRGTLPRKAVISFDPTKPRYINQSPYVQNCTNFIPDSIGIKVDGNAAIGPIKSMVLDSYTQYNQGGIGASITNQGYAQLVSMFTICNEEAIMCASGGACDLTNSNSSFGDYGLVADGVSGKKYSGIVTTAAAALSDQFEIDLSTSTLSVSTATYTASTGEITITTTTDHDFNVGMGVTISDLVMNCGGSDTDIFPSGKNGYTFNVTEVVSSTQFKTFVGVSTLNHYYESGGTVKTEVVRPYDGQAVFFNDLYETVDTITITDGGSGYTSAPIVTVSSPSVSWGIAAKAIATIGNGSVTSINMLSNGRGYESAPTITFAAPSSGINTATGTAVLKPEYYTINSSTEISNGISTITINENVPHAVGVGTTVNFFKQSRILATGHSFEFIGSGTEIASSIPYSGGSPPIPENETDSRNGGLVVHTSTNQSGNFKIGDGVTINQNTSSITGQAYEKSLVSTITPYILSLGAL